MGGIFNEKVRYDRTCGTFRVAGTEHSFPRPRNREKRALRAAMSGSVTPIFPTFSELTASERR